MVDLLQEEVVGAFVGLRAASAPSTDRREHWTLRQTDESLLAEGQTGLGTVDVDRASHGGISTVAFVLFVFKIEFLKYLFQFQFSIFKFLKYLSEDRRRTYYQRSLVRTSTTRTAKDKRFDPSPSPSRSPTTALLINSFFSSTTTTPTNTTNHVQNLPPHRGHHHCRRYSRTVSR